MVKELKGRLGRGFKLGEVSDENTLRLSIAMTNTESSLPKLSCFTVSKMFKGGTIRPRSS